MARCCRSARRSLLVRWLLATGCVAILALLAGWACAAEPMATPGEIAALIRALGHDDFDQREAASKRLADLGEDALAPLKLAAESRDAEVRRRATELMALIERRLFGELAILVGHTEGLWSGTFSPDGKRAATCSDDKSLRLWDLDTGRQVGRLDLPSAVNCARFFADGQRLLIGLANGECGVYEIVTGKCLLAIGKHTDEVVGLEILPGEKEVVTVSRDRTLKVWELQTPKLVRTCVGHTDMIRNVAVSPAGDLAATASFDGTIRIWRLADGETLQVLQPGCGMIFGVGFSPDGRQVVSGAADHHARIWDVDSGEELQRLEGHTGFVYSATFLPGGRRMLTSSEDRTIRVWQLSTGKVDRIFQGHTDYVRHVQVAPDGKRFLSSSKDHTSRLWNVPRE